MIILMYSIVLVAIASYIIFLRKSLMLFGGLFYLCAVTQTYIVFVYLISGIITSLTGFFPRKIWHKKLTGIITIMTAKFKYYNTNIISKMSETYKIIEYPLILLFIIGGGILLLSCSDVVSIFLSIELQSYGLYLLCSIYRNSESSTSAGLTYFLLGGLSSTFILLGSSLLYVNYGTTSLDGYYMIGNIVYNVLEDIIKPLLINTSLLIMLVGFLFKISAAPFHFWSPDVYDAIPTIVTTFVAIVAKISILILIFSIIQYTVNLYTSIDFNWKLGILLSSLLSLGFGTILGLISYRIKRLLAYSTIAHLGFILLSISINNLDSIEAFMFYLITYSLSNLNMFFIVIAIGYSLYVYHYEGFSEKVIKSLSDRNYSPIQLIVQIKGYFSNYPYISTSLGITLFSLVGIPPLIGFFAKQMVLSAALANGYIFITLIAVATSVISAVYYLNVVTQTFFEGSDHKKSKADESVTYSGILKWLTGGYSIIKFKADNIALTGWLSTTISVLTLWLSVYIIEPSNLLKTVQILGLLKENT